VWLFGRVPAGEGELSGFFHRGGLSGLPFPRPKGEGGAASFWFQRVAAAENMVF